MLQSRKFIFGPWLHLISAILVICTSTSNSISTSTITAKPGCPTQCGDVLIPYPFGIGLDGACSMGLDYRIRCNTSNNPPKPFYGTGNIEIVDISEATGQMRIKNLVASSCYSGGKEIESHQALINLTGSPLLFSDSANKFTVIGCDDLAVIDGGSDEHTFTTGCFTGCSHLSDVINGSCTGIGCCQTSIPKGYKTLATSLGSAHNHTNVSLFNPCGFAFLAEVNSFTFNVSDLTDPNFAAKTNENVPIMIEWMVGVDQTCDQARKNSSGYACQLNSNCTDLDTGSGGYRCNCLSGFEGNPYLSPGCTDIDECKDPNNACIHECTNTNGSFICSCPKGQVGDGLKNGTRCTDSNSQFNTRISIALSLSLLLLLIMMTWIYFVVKRNKRLKAMEKFFEQNGGLLLKQQIASQGDTTSSQDSLSKIFSADELSTATNNYSEDSIIGKGGYGMVYKGLLKDGREVAIKKSKVADKSQIEQFINEVIILTQINHRYVVKLLGCCLETEVPLLVYEFIPNGTLFEYIHKKGNLLNWENCVRIASEAADAFAYLHSEASIPIIHRDIKSSNILLDYTYTTKVADFGASRLIPIGKTEVVTLVQGTVGYLDPEYLLTGQLTDKSDVYSFGVVLAELLTKETPSSSSRNLSLYFIMAMKENRLTEIINPVLAAERDADLVLSMATLIKKCLSVQSEDRPTMKEVARELEGMKKQIKNEDDQLNYQQTVILSKGSDLYPPSSSSTGFSPSSAEFSEQYNVQIHSMMDTKRLLDI